MRLRDDCENYASAVKKLTQDRGDNMIKVLIAEDIKELARRFAGVLRRDPAIQVVGCVQRGDEAVAESQRLCPDIILMDIEMETKTAGLDATQEIIKKQPEIKIIILTVYEDDEMIFQAFQMGVTDYILKNSLPQDFTTCIKEAYEGHSPIRPVIAKKIRREFQRIRNSENSFLYCLNIVTQLTQKEIDVLDLISQGYTRTQICELRCVELSTVKTQIHNILKKFGCASMSEVVAQIEEAQVFEYIRNISGSLSREEKK